MSSPRHLEPGRRRHRAPHHRSPAPARTGRGQHRTPSHTPTRTAGPATLWSFADAEPLPGTALLAGWLGRTIVTLVTTYTRPGDRVLLLTPSAPLHAPRRACGRPHDGSPYAGLAEAVWTVARLGRGADTATAAPPPDDPREHSDPAERTAGESGPRPRLSRLGLHPATDPGPESAHRPRHAGGRTRGTFDLIITAADPHATDWLAHTAWDTLRTPHGLTAIVTHSDMRAGRLVDPQPAIVRTLSHHGLQWSDHITVLDTPVPDPAPGGPAPAVADTAPPVRTVHHDLLLFGRPATTAPAPGAVARKETSDA
ncbi:hypothetical protein [Amycolatopsis aidingensis]|uniref:hypothetical protein n=1 Tax=Amycolatopsis aidingensis TaxID=2842453 RepID=UPI001C0B489B|nr:hypothetical protein [Amycolatopsis aidingensis]